jgi:HhH-GPD superfamily base excision DNA repair protein
MKPEQIQRFFSTLQAANPHPVTELEYTSVFELLAAVLLSAQATDVGVNKATRRLFPVANTPSAIIALGLAGLEDHIKTIGLFRSKAKHLMATCHLLLRDHGGRVPRTREAQRRLWATHHGSGHPYFSRRQPHRPGHWRHTAGRRAQAAQTHSPRLSDRCAPLVDPARTVCVPGAQPQMRGLRRVGLLRPCGQGPARCREKKIEKKLSNALFTNTLCYIFR